jgi:hypothetical protein
MDEQRSTCWAFSPRTGGRLVHGAGRDLRDGMTAQRAMTFGSGSVPVSGLVA